jgi:hypothetical protein
MEEQKTTQRIEGLIQMIFIFRVEYEDKSFLIKIEDTNELNAWYRTIKHLKKKNRSKLNRVDLISIDYQKTVQLSKIRIFKSTGSNPQWLCRHEE